jgi:hypothetical protein
MPVGIMAVVTTAIGIMALIAAGIVEAAGIMAVPISWSISWPIARLIEGPIAPSTALIRWGSPSPRPRLEGRALPQPRAPVR